MGKTIIFSLGLVMLLTAVQPALAQTNSEIELLTGISAEDLSIEEQNILPTNPFGYFFKDLIRRLELGLAFGEAKKAGLELEQASERLWEIKEMVETFPDKIDIEKYVAKNQDKYQELMQSLNVRLQKLQADDKQSELQSLLDGFIKRQLAQQELLADLEQRAVNLPSSSLQKFRQISDEALAGFGQTMEKTENKNNVRERLIRLLKPEEEGDASVNTFYFMEKLADNINNPEIRQGLFEAREIIRSEILDSLASEVDSEKIDDFANELENIPGSELMQLRIINFFEDGLSERSIRSLENRLNEITKQKQTSFKNKLNSAKSLEQREAMFNEIEQAADFNAIEVLEELRKQLDNPELEKLIDRTQTSQSVRLEEIIGTLDDFQAAEEFKLRLDKEQAVRQRVQLVNPEAVQSLNEKVEQYHKLYPRQTKPDSQ